MILGRSVVQGAAGLGVEVFKTDRRTLAARRAGLLNIRTFTFGGHRLSAVTTTAGTLDFLAWGVGQTGAFYQSLSLRLAVRKLRSVRVRRIPAGATLENLAKHGATADIRLHRTVPVGTFR